MVPHSFNFFL